MDDVLKEPRWLLHARSLWPRDSAPRGLDRKWSPIWIRAYLDFLRERNGGRLPEDKPDVGSLGLFETFLFTERSCGGWQVEQAHKAVVWLLGVVAGEGDVAEPGEIESRTKVELEPVGLAAFSEVTAFWDASVDACELVRMAVRRMGRSLRTEKTYVGWARRFVAWWRRNEAAGRSLADVDEAKGELERAISCFLDHLAIEADVARASQKQALNALVFCFRSWFKAEPGSLPEFRVAARGRKVPVVLSRDEVSRLISCVDPSARLLVKLLYGGGLRLIEVLRLRVKDLDFDLGVVVVRDGKGGKDRRTTLPVDLVADLREHLLKVRAFYEQDRAAGRDGVYMPQQLGKKFPNASKEWIWQYVFPSERLQKDPRSDAVRRHHVNERFVQRAIQEASGMAGIDKHVTPHTLRHTFATELLRAHYDIRTVQELLGHASVETTMIYTHALNRPGLHVKSPLDELKDG